VILSFISLCRECCSKKCDVAGRVYAIMHCGPAQSRQTYKTAFLYGLNNHSLSCEMMHIRSRSRITSGGRSARVSRYRAHSGACDLSEGCFLKVAVLSLWSALSDERSIQILTTRTFYIATLSVSHRKHVSSPLRAQQVTATCRFVTMVYQ
jgi:hypothetical protein